MVKTARLCMIVFEGVVMQVCWHSFMHTRCLTQQKHYGKSLLVFVLRALLCGLLSSLIQNSFCGSLPNSKHSRALKLSKRSICALSCKITKAVITNNHNYHIVASQINMHTVKQKLSSPHAAHLSFLSQVFLLVLALFFLVEGAGSSVSET